MYKIPKVEDALDQSRFSVKEKDGPCICYDDVPLWRTGVPLEATEIFLYDPTGCEEPEPYTLMCRDGYDDIYTYGDWETMEDVMAWLDKPTRLY